MNPGDAFVVGVLHADRAMSETVAPFAMACSIRNAQCEANR